MKFFWSLVLMFIAFSAAAADKSKIALVTSFKTTDGKNILNFINYDSNKKVEKKFIKSFPSDKYELQVIHHASLGELWNVLHDSSVDAVFFVGHGTRSEAGPVGSDSLILDENLINVSGVFSDVSPNLKYLGIISCYSEKVIEEYKEKGFYKNAPLLKVTAFPGEIELMKGIKQTIAESLQVISPDRPQQAEDTDDDDTFTVELTRSPGEKRLPALILHNEKALGYFDSSTPNESVTVKIPKREASSYKLVADSGLVVLNKKSSIGEIQIKNDNGYHCSLKAERNRKGEILGVSKNYYRLECDSHPEEVDVEVGEFFFR